MNKTKPPTHLHIILKVVLQSNLNKTPEKVAEWKPGKTPPQLIDAHSQSASTAWKKQPHFSLA